MPDHKFLILICAAFSPDITLTYAEKFKMIQGALTELLSQDEIGQIHLFQATVQYFIKKQPSQKNHASEICLAYYNESMIEDQFFINWHAKSKKGRTDKESDLYDRKAEKEMRTLLDEFVTWLQSDADYDEEAGKYTDARQNWKNLRNFC